jgi:hypothetical protein
VLSMLQHPHLDMVNGRVAISLFRTDFASWDSRTLAVTTSSAIRRSLNGYLLRPNIRIRRYAPATCGPTVSAGPINLV